MMTWEETVVDLRESIEKAVGWTEELEEKIAHAFEEHGENPHLLDAHGSALEAMNSMYEIKEAVSGLN